MKSSVSGGPWSSERENLKQIGLPKSTTAQIANKIKRDELLGWLDKQGFDKDVPMGALPSIIVRLLTLMTLTAAVIIAGYGCADAGSRQLLKQRSLSEPAYRVINRVAPYAHVGNEVVARCIAIIASVFAGKVAWKYLARVVMGSKCDSIFIRGRRLLTSREANKVARGITSQSENTVSWAELTASHDAVMRPHVCFVGRPGSGKTLLIKRSLAETLPAIGCGTGIGCGTDKRAVIYDYKGDQFSYLCGLANVPVYTLNSGDLRCVAWDMAKDVDSVTLCDQAAAAFIPDDNSPNRFFIDAPRNYVSCTLQALSRIAPGQWTLRDLLLALQEPQYVRQLVSRFNETRPALQYGAEPQTFQNLLSSIQAKMFPYTPIAGCWHRASRKISLKEWISGDMILHLGATEGMRFQQDALNRLVIQRAAELALSQSESFTRCTYLYIDETRAIGKVPQLGHCLTAGRSKGIIVVAGFQDIEGLRHVYGDHEADEIAGLCGGKVLLSMSSPKTATWASEVVARADWKEYPGSGLNENTLQGGSITQQRSERPVITASEFLSFPPTSPKTGLTGVFLNPSIGVFKTTLDWTSVINAIPPAPAHIPDFVPRPNDHQLLPPWTPAEMGRLGLRPASDSAGGTLVRKRPK